MNSKLDLGSEEEVKNKVRESAKKNFRIGLNCSESVYSALLESGLIDLPPETIKLATAFGGGMGLSGGVCGALIGALLGVSSVHGRYNLSFDNKSEIIDQLYGNPGLYRFFNQVPYKFTCKFGSTQCSELNKEYKEWTDKERLRNCMNIVVEAAAIAVETIFQGEREGYNQPFGPNMANKV